MLFRADLQISREEWESLMRRKMEARKAEVCNYITFSMTFLSSFLPEEREKAIFQDWLKKLSSQIRVHLFVMNPLTLEKHLDLLCPSLNL